MDEFILKVNENLLLLENDLIKGLKDNNQPLVIFCFAPRSGSTLISQVLARSGSFNYISNFQANFWLTPYVGGLLEQKMGLREKYLNMSSEYNSDLGRTELLSDPHEFGYFWNKYIPFSNNSHLLSKKQINNIDFTELITKIIAIKSLEKKPLFIKNSILGLNVELAHKLFPNAKFIILKRDLYYTIQSVLLSRRKYYGNDSSFWSLKPSNIKCNTFSSPLHEIYAQVNGIYQDIFSQLKDLKIKFLDVEYESFVLNPNSELKRMWDFIGTENPLPWLNPLHNRNIDKLTPKESQILKEILKTYT